MSTTLALQVEDCSPTLGELMCAFRTDHGESMRAVSRRCELDPADIAQVELGRADLDTEALAGVVQAYAVPRTRFPVNHSQVVVDLVSGGVVVRPRHLPVEESSTDAMLLTYLELLYENKQLPADAEVTFTSLDLDLVRLMLSSHKEEVEARIDDLVLPARPVSPLRRHAPAATFLVGAAAAAVALLVSIAIGQARSSVDPAAISTTDPVVVAQPETGTASPGAPAEIDPRDPGAAPSGGAVVIPVKIIDPLVVTRQPDGRVTSSDRASEPAQPSKETK